MSNNNKTDYGELFCEAIDTIVAERLNAVTKDVTVLCTVVDDSKRQEGKYVVTETNSQTKFEAFSDNTEYRKDNNVYVTIPKGDMNEAKFIIGKKQKDELEEAYTYTRPFDTIVDVSGNLITAEIPVEKTGLVANEPDNDGYDDAYQTITLWTYNTDTLTIVADKGEQLKGFTRLGIKGDFRSWLNQFYVNVGGKSVAAAAKTGSYGLRLRIQTINENVVNEENKDGFYDLYLDVEDMNGNPYNFQTFYRQEKVFNIENIGQIVSMELQLYEKPGTFTNNINEEQIPWSDFLGNKINPNIFVKDCYICVGYDVAAFKDDQVMLYTLDDSTYRPDATDLENQKLVQLRWVNDFGNKIKVVNETDNLNADVRWYRYQLGAPSPDEYAGYHWTRVNDKISIIQEIEIPEINELETFDIIYHYKEPGVTSTNRQIRNSAYYYEKEYLKTFAPEYKNFDTREIIIDETVLSLWSDECLAYYGFMDNEVIRDNGFIGFNYADHEIERYDAAQSWEDIAKQGFVVHNANHDNVVDDRTGESFDNKDCLHPIGCWERLIFAWRMYHKCPDKFDEIMPTKFKTFWRQGGNYEMSNPNLWSMIGDWKILTSDINNCYLYTTDEHAGFRYKLEDGVYKILPASSDDGEIIPANARGCTGTSSTTEYWCPLRNAGTLFAASFGDWVHITDKYGLGDYVPVNAEAKLLVEEAIDELFKALNNPYIKKEIKPNVFSYLFTPDITLQEERLKAIVLYEGDVLRSNTLYFYNEIEVPSQPTINAMSAAEIVTLDANEGNYFIYDIGNSIKNHADSTEVRELDLYFNGAQLTIADEVEWLIPIQNTMIVLDDEFKGVNFDEVSVPGYCKIIRRGGGEKGDDITGSTKQRYRIKSYWSQDDTNNTIYCTIRQYGVDYPAVREFSFGPSGTSGTDCTLVLDFEDGITALTIGNPQAVVARARLYDYNNKLVDLTNYNVNWNIFSGLTENAGTKTNLILTGHNDTREIQLKSTVTTVPTDNYDILQATVTNFGDYELTAYLPLPIKADTTYKYIEGATKLIYNSIGNIDNYYKDPYKLYYTDGDDVTSTFGVWTINNGVAGDVNYLPQLTTSTDKATSTTTYSLQATSIYVPETCTKVNVTGSVNGDIVWSQPLLIMQNRYPSAMINEWDGSLKLDEENNAILAAKMVAGRKEDDNTFSGVMMGDWHGEDVEGEIANHTGIYGFNKGVASFGFRDNGTAFIGKPGSGRIEFDGEEGVITSNSYEDGVGGIKIDLDDGILYAQSPNNAIDDSELNTDMRKGYLTINAAHTTTPLSIGPTEDGGRGNYFYVDWDGTFKATTGYIGPWELDDYGFTNGKSGDEKIYLYADGTMVMGAGSDRIKLEAGQITIGNKNASNQIILKANPGTNESAIMIGPSDNQIQIGDAAINLGNFSSTTKETSRISIDPTNITMGIYSPEQNAFTSKTIINGDGITVSLPSYDSTQGLYTEINAYGVSSTAFTVLEYGTSVTDFEKAGVITYGYSDRDEGDVSGALGIEIRSANYHGMDVDYNSSVLKVTDSHIAGTTYESTFIIDENSASIGMVSGINGLTASSGHLVCDAEGSNLRGETITFYYCDEIKFTTGDRNADPVGIVTIDFSTVNAKNLYAVLA